MKNLKRIISFVKNRTILSELMTKFECRKNYLYDSKMFSQNCIDVKGRGQLKARILLIVHQIEKGLTYKENRRIFGEKKIKLLIGYIEKYLKLYEADDIIILAINILYVYVNSDNSTKDVSVRNKINELLKTNKNIIGQIEVGTKLVTEPHNFNEKDILYFFKSRSSVRSFSNNIITDEEICKVIDFANCTPSACNRQASRVHVYRDKEKMKLLIDNQLGNQNWCDNADTLFVITSDMRYFNSSYEHLEPYIDGSLYAMNFVWGLHLYKIASCYKMYVRLPKIDREFHSLSNIPNYEVPIILVLAGHYKDNAILAPKSYRFPSQDILFIHK